MLIFRLILKITLILLLTTLYLSTTPLYSTTNSCTDLFLNPSQDSASIEQQYTTRLDQASNYVLQTIENRTNPLITNSSDHSFPKLNSDPSAIASIQAGIKQLYLREELQKLVRYYRLEMEKTISTWLGIITGISSRTKQKLTTLNRELATLNSKLLEKTEDQETIKNSIKNIEESILNLTTNNPLLKFAPTYRLNSHLEKFSPEARQQLILGNLDLESVFKVFPNEKKLPETPGQISKTVENLRLNFKRDEIARFDTLYKTIAAKYHEYWTSHFSFGGYQVISSLSMELTKYLSDLFNKLNNALIFEDLQKDFYKKVSRLRIDKIPFTTFTQDPNSDISFQAGTAISGNYGIKTAGVMIYPSSGYNNLQYHPKVYFLHGATTFHSNVKSFSDLLPVAKNSYFLNPIALDIWGSMENYGIAISPLDPTKPEQLAFYMENFYQQIETTTKIEAPLIIGGRSSGSTTEFIHALYYHLAGKPISTDLLYLVSFSNLLTGKEQLLSVREQEKQGLLTLVPESDKRIDTLYTSVLKDLENIKTHAPELLVKDGFGDNIINVQGERDLDGGSTVVEDLTTFRDRYTPLAHIYVFKDPLKNYPEFAKFLEQFGQGEASHFLYNSNPNMSLDFIEPLLPEDIRKTLPQDRKELIKLLPKYKDQLSEVVALKYAMLDYLINSPFTNESQRKKLSDLRFKLTGSNYEFAYLEWFINKEAERLSRRQNNNENEDIITFQNVLESTNVDKNSVLYRYQKVYNYVLQELERAEELKIKYNL